MFHYDVPYVPKKITIGLSASITSKGEGIGTLGSAEQTLSVVSELAIPHEDKANSPVTAVTGEEEV